MATRGQRRQRPVSSDDSLAQQPQAKRQGRPLTNSALVNPDPNQIYDSLCPSRKEIRLLEIVETSPVIKCQLSIVSLNEKPAFCAISYVWGKEKVFETIHVNGVLHAITKSLADALRHTPMHWKIATGEQDVTRLRIWADALCINQEDKDEKNHQVPLMEEIYPSANITFCCLDSVSPTSKLPSAIRGLSAIAAGIVESGFDPKAKEEVVTLEVLGEYLSSPENPPSTEYVLSTENQLPSKTDRKARFWAANMHALLSSPLTEPLSSFTHLSYWRRAWIFQEIVLSKRSILFYADESIEFETLAMINKWARKAMEQPKPKNFPWMLQDLIQSLRFNACFKLLLSRDGLAIQKMCQVSDEFEKEASAALIGAQDYLGSCLEATNPKDHVYALLGVTGLRITPHYENEVSVASVYTEFCVEQLNAVRGTSGSDIKFLRFSGLVNGDPEQKDILPSWVPNFPVCSTKGIYLLNNLEREDHDSEEEDQHSEGEDHQSEGEDHHSGEGDHHSRDDHRSWAEAIGSVKDVRICDSSLFTAHLPIDTVEDISEVLSDSRGSGSPESYTAFVLSVFELLRLADSSSSTSDDIHPFLKLTSAFYRARVCDPAWLSPLVVRVARMLQFLVMGKGGGSKPGIWSFGSTFRSSSFTTEVCGVDVTPGTAVNEEDPGVAMESFSMAFFGWQMMDEDTFMKADTFIQTVKDAGSFSKPGIRVARTKGNELVLVPPVAEKGDQIVLLAGFRDVYLIRKQDNHYVHVGPVGIAHEVVDSVLQQSSMNNESHVRIELR